MSSLAPTDRRYAVRVGIARYTLFASGWAFAAAVLLGIGALFSAEIWQESAYATSTGTALAFLVVLALSLAAIGAAFGLGRCRVGCAALLLGCGALIGLLIAAS